MSTALRRLLSSGSVALAALTLSGASVAHAQGTGAATRPVSIGITGGLSIPTGDFGDFYSSGFNAGGLLEFSRPASPLAFRLEGEYQRFGIKDEVTVGDPGDLRVISGVANVVYKFGGVMARPYVLGGVGLFNVGITEGDGDPENEFGFNVGAGLELPLSGITAFADIRYQSIQTEGDAFNLVPIRVGIRF
jgi:opacity protein-like surface antigen